MTAEELLETLNEIQKCKTHDNMESPGTLRLRSG